MSRDMHLSLPDALWTALEAHCQRTGESLNHAVATALAEMLDVKHHTIYQVSTSGALVEGVFGGCVRVADILRHGDFGLGTFDGLDGEGLLIDGRCWQARSDGSVHEAPPDARAPFWVATHFVADQTHVLEDIRDWDDLARRIDALRPSDNIFAAIRMRGDFEKIRYRVACKAAPGTDLVSATSRQAEFSFEAIAGLLVGFWTPSYARTINVPGYHLHFMSADYTHAGHVLDLSAKRLALELHLESNLHLALPETPAFLGADLSHDPSAALAKAEGGER